MTDDEVTDIGIAIGNPTAPGPYSGDGTPAAPEATPTESRPTDRLATRVLVALAAVAGIGLVGSTLFDRAASEPSALLALPTAEAAAEPVTEAQTLPTEEPVPAGSPGPPDLIAVDGSGGFVGVTTRALDPGRSTFSTSADGVEWIDVHAWDIGPDRAVSRLERVGDKYAVWFDDRDPSTGHLLVGVSQDLVSWEMLAFESPEAAPRGLTYEYSLADLATSGATTLAVIELDIELHFAALALYESSTCGHRITESSATVRLCNGADLDVFSFSDITALPMRSQLFVSHNGSEFEPTPLPFGRSGPVRLSSTPGRFGLTNQIGLGFATSTNATDWTFVVGPNNGRVRVKAAATGEDGRVVGVGFGGARRSVLFTASPAVQTTPLAAVLGREPNDYVASVSSGVAGWAIIVSEPTGLSWVLFSPDGMSWVLVTEAIVTGAPPEVFVGDVELLIRAPGGSGVVTTFRVDR